ncbi:MAG: hypothetical protein F6K47_30660 [Symploca sp. SIO2E6]|nr:hypothetical protein [Symploca sp. SIO2E6]
MGIGNWELGIGNWELGIGNWQQLTFILWWRNFFMGTALEPWSLLPPVPLLGGVRGGLYLLPPASKTLGQKAI